MPSASIDFPTSSSPGLLTTENGGRLINALIEKAPEGSRSPAIIRRAPGLRFVHRAAATPGIPRGALAVGGVLYVIIDDTAYVISKSGGTYSSQALSGSVPGSGRVMIERNRRAPQPQILIQHDLGMSQITEAGVVDFADPDLPATNSLAYLSSYFIATSADGRAFASGINDVTFNANDYAAAEASPDALVRAVAVRQDLLLMGESTIEFWSNVGNATGFPFSRAHVLPVGLKAPFAVAGHEPGFPNPLVWVGNDGAVYQLDGYAPSRISTTQIERMILAVANPASLEAGVHVVAGRAFWALTSPDWTWVYDMTLGSWTERQSYGKPNWRASVTVNAFDAWMAFDAETGDLFVIDDGYQGEGDQPLVWDIRSVQSHRFPGRFAIHKASFDFATGVGNDRGRAPTETNPRVSISWSDDGGVSFGTPLERDLGTQGERKRIDLNRTGLTGRQGRQWRIQCSDPVPVSFMGAVMDLEARGA